MVRASVRATAFPPSMRGIGQAVGLFSTACVARQLMALERKGFLRQGPAMVVVGPVVGCRTVTMNVLRK
jgi:SOS-response transcriptional repressor LexA